MGIDNEEAERSETTPDEVEQMLGEVMLFEPVMIHNYLHDEFDRDYPPIAAIPHGAPIEFNISGATQLYYDLNNLLVRVRAHVTDAANHPPDNNHHPGVVNDPFNSMWRDQILTLNGRCINKPNNMYAWKSYLMSLLNYLREVQDIGLKCEC